MLVYTCLLSFVFSLSWNCEYPEFGDISSSHYLYKEDNVNEVKWLEKYEYCRAKGDPTVYRDAGQGKCEYSRGLCFWNGQCSNTLREQDALTECRDLFRNNILVDGLDNGRKPVVPITSNSPVVSITSNSPVVPTTSNSPVVSTTSRVPVVSTTSRVPRPSKTDNSDFKSPPVIHLFLCAFI